MSFFFTESREAHSKLNDSRITPLIDWVTMFVGVVEATDVTVDDGGVVVTGLVAVGVGALVEAGLSVTAVVICVGVDTSVEDELDDDELDEEPDDELDDDELDDELDDDAVDATSDETDAFGKRTSALRLRSSPEPPHAEAASTSAAKTKDRRLWITPETLFRRG